MNLIIKEKRPYLLSEIGGDHDCNFEYAKKLLNLAIDSKLVNCIKFQISSNYFDFFRSIALKDIEPLQVIIEGVDFLEINKKV